MSIFNKDKTFLITMISGRSYEYIVHKDNTIDVKSLVNRIDNYINFPVSEKISIKTEFIESVEFVDEEETK